VVAPGAFLAGTAGPSVVAAAAPRRAGHACAAAPAHGHRKGAPRCATVRYRDSRGAIRRSSSIASCPG
jgi:hypothetical protein